MSRKRQSGYVLIVVISLLSVLMIIGVSFAGFAYYGLQRTASVRDSMQAYYAAKSGINRALLEIQKSGTTQGEIETVLIPSYDSSLKNIRIHSIVTWKTTSDDPVLGKGSNTIVITAQGLVENNPDPILDSDVRNNRNTPLQLNRASRQIRAQRGLRAVLDPAGTGKILYVTEISQADAATSTQKGTN